MPTDCTASDTQSTSRPERRAMVIFGFLMLTQFIATMDNQIVATAMPTIVGDLGEAEHFSWLVSAYMLAQCAVMPIYGKLGDLIGRKTIVIAALLVFTLGSVLCAVSWSMTSLIAARTLQGLGNGGLLVSVFAVTADLFEPRTRARFQGYLSFVFVLGSFIGPALGGYMTVAFGWRSIFLVTVPLSLLAAFGFWRFMVLRPSDRQPVIDYAGALLLALIVTMGVFWVDSIRLFGSFVSPISLGLGVLIPLGLWLWIRVEKHAAEPVVPLSLMMTRNFALLIMATVCNGAVSIGLVAYFAYFLQMGVGLTPAQAGLFFIAITLGVSTGAMLAGRLMSAGVHFTRPLRGAFALSATILTLIAQLPHDLPNAYIAGLFVMQGLSMGLAMNAIVLGGQISAPQRDVGAATGVISLTRTIGAALAIAIYGTIIATGVAGGMTSAGKVGSQMTPAVLETLPAPLRDEVIALYSDSFTTMFQTASCIALLGLGLALMMRRPTSDTAARA